MGFWVFCHNFDAIDEDTPFCCSSCHEDQDEGYYNGMMCQDEFANGKLISEVCCAISRYHVKLPKPEYRTVTAKAFWHRRKEIQA